MNGTQNDTFEIDQFKNKTLQQPFIRRKDNFEEPILTSSIYDSGDETPHDIQRKAKKNIPRKKLEKILDSTNQDYKNDSVDLTLLNNKKPK